MTSPAAWPLRLVALSAAAGATAAVPGPGPEVPEADRARFEAYAARVEEGERQRGDRPFLHLDRLEREERDPARASALRGRPWVRRIQARNADGTEVDLDDGMLHHWVGGVFVPDHDLEQLLGLSTDFERYPTVFAPDVVAARLLERRDDRLHAYMRFTKTKVITLTYDSEHRVRIFREGARRARTHSHATSLRQVEDAGSPTERLLPAGHGRLHGMHVWWRYEESRGGVWVENESLVLTDDVGFPASLVVGPLLRAGPREGVVRALEQTRAALFAEVSSR